MSEEGQVDFKETTVGAQPTRLTDPLLGIVLNGRYKIESLLGSGGWGNVYLAEHLSLGCMVAVKALHSHLAKQGDSQARLEREAKLLSRIDSPFVVKTIDYGLEPVPYLVMEYFKGQSLESYINLVGLPDTEQALSIFKQLCLGLNAAHELGLVHRDLKPSNILMQEERNAGLKILDFGLAKILDEGEGAPRVTMTGEIMGSPPYMAPEQWAGQIVSARTDIYSLGCLMYELFTGKSCFKAESSMQYMAKHMNQKPAKFSDSAPGKKFPSGIELVVMKCLQKNPQHRYADCQQLLDDINKATGGQKISLSLHNDRFVLLPNSGQNRSRRLLVVAAVTLSLVGVFALSVFLNREHFASVLADHLLTIAVKYSQEGNFKESELAYRQALTLAESVSFSPKRRLQAVRGLIAIEKKKGNLVAVHDLQELEFKLIGRQHSPEKMLVFKKAMYHRDQSGDLRFAEDYAKQLLEMVKADGLNTDLHAASLDLLGSIYRDQGKVKEALPLHKEAVRISDELLDPNDYVLAERLNNLGMVERRAGRYPEALTAFERSIAINRKVSPTSLASNYNNMISIYLNMGDFGAAEEICRKAVEANKTYQSGKGAIVHNSWAYVSMKQGKPDEAEKHLLDAMKAAKTEGTTDFFERIQPIINLGLLYKQSGKNGRATELLMEAARQLAPTSRRSQSYRLVQENLQALAQIKLKRPELFKDKLPASFW